MRILFLDLDGVLNIKYKLSPEDREPTFDADCVRHLNSVLAYADYDIVVTSTWRMRHGVKALNRLLRVRGVEADVVGTIDVPVFDASDMLILNAPSRPSDIRKWLSEHPGVTHYAVLDDVEATTREFLTGVHVQSHQGVTRQTARHLVDIFTA